MGATSQSKKYQIALPETKDCNQIEMYITNKMMNENLNNIVGSETNIYIEWYLNIVTFNWTSQYEFLFNLDSGNDGEWTKDGIQMNFLKLI